MAESKNVGNLGRLLRLLSLLQTPRDWSGPQLAERLEVSTRTIRKDVERLRDLDYPVHAIPGAAGGYWLGPGAQMPPLLLDDEEAVAVAVGLRAAAAGSIEGIEETSLRALAKLEQVLPTRVRNRVTSLHAATVALTCHADEASVDPETLTVVARCIRAGEEIRFDYRARDRSESTRLIEPHRMVSAGRRWYLVAWDLDRDDWRTFRVDRISGPQRTGVRTVPRELPAPDAAAYVQQALSSWQTGYEAVVTLHAPINAVSDQAPRSVGSLEPLDEHACKLRTTADSIEWLALRIAMLGFDFEVHSPPELVDYLHNLGARITRASSR